MIIFIFYGIVWIGLALIRIPLVEDWAFIPTGNPYHWWPILGLRLFLALACFQIARLKYRLGDKF